MNEFKQYKRRKIAELRPVTNEEIEEGRQELMQKGISISIADQVNGSPKEGDMIARNPKNYNDQWLVNSQYFKENFFESLD